MIVVVSDTSAISSLLQIGEIEILRQLYGQILIPEAVRAELKRSHAQIPGFIQTESVSPSPALQARLKSLDIGEAYAITLAEQIHADLLLIDEKKGRAAAARAGIQYMGLAGALIEAKRKGIISSLADILEYLTVDAGFRLSLPIRTAILKAVGE